MGQIKVEKNVGGIEGLCVITPAVHGDDRGYFMETYNEKDMKEAGIDVKFVQDNQSMSVKGVNDFYHPNDEGGMAWNDPEIGIEWPQLKGEYQGSASAEGYTLEDGTSLILSDKDQKWLGLKDTFKF